MDDVSTMGKTYWSRREINSQAKGAKQKALCVDLGDRHVVGGGHCHEPLWKRKHIALKLRTYFAQLFQVGMYVIVLQKYICHVQYPASCPFPLSHNAKIQDNPCTGKICCIKTQSNIIQNLIASIAHDLGTAQLASPLISSRAAPTITHTSYQPRRISVNIHDPTLCIVSVWDQVAF
jgi:hypothetical protein